MKLVVTIPFFYADKGKYAERAELTRMMFKNLKNAQELLETHGHEMEVVLVGSEGDHSRELATM